MRHKKTIEEEDSINFTYRLTVHKLIEKNVKKKRPDDITIDKKGEVIKFDKNLAVSFIPFGMEQNGLVLFPFPLNSADINL